MPLRSNRFAAWIAILATALNALLPVAAQARPSATLFSASICASGGGSVPGDNLDHCRLCIAGGDRLPVLNGNPDLAVRAASHCAEASLATPAEAFRSTSGSSAQPRAPPTIL